MSETLNIKGAADLLHVHPKTVAGLIEQGAIPAAIVGRAYMMMRRDVLSYAQQVITAQTSARMRKPMGRKG